MKEQYSKITIIVVFVSKYHQQQNIKIYHLLRYKKSYDILTKLCLKITINKSNKILPFQYIVFIFLVVKIIFSFQYYLYNQIFFDKS